MRIRTLFAYLIGSRTAILAIAANRWAAPLGFVFVLSAGLAREYDGADLLHEPWHALLPIPASLATSFLLFCFTYGIPFEKHPPEVAKGLYPPFWRGFWMFLGLFWLTAPLAWLYGIPYERFLSEADATRANLYTLEVVAIWRVVLMCRVVHVLMGYTPWQAIALVFVLADAEALLAVWLSPVPLFDFMGGIRYTESERVIRTTAANTLLLAACSFPFWILLGIAAAVKAQPVWCVLQFAESSPEERTHTMSILAGMSLLGWTLLLPFTQPELILRLNVERLFKAEQFEAALDVMSAHEANAFPPHWNPPPRSRLGHGDINVPLLDIVELIAKQPTAPWVREVYLSKLKRYIKYPYMSEKEAERLARLLRNLPERDEILEELQSEFDYRHHPLKEILEKEEKRK